MHLFISCMQLVAFAQGQGLAALQLQILAATFPYFQAVWRESRTYQECNYLACWFSSAACVMCFRVLKVPDGTSSLCLPESSQWTCCERDHNMQTSYNYCQCTGAMDQLLFMFRYTAWAALLLPSYCPTG